MNRGRPRGPTKLKTRKSYLVAGRYQERLDRLRAKREKLAMLELLISAHERQPNPNHDDIRNMRHRAKGLRNQLAVTSTIEPITKE